MNSLVDKFRISPIAFMGEINDKVEIKVYNSNKISWESENEAIASVNNGIVTCIGVGETSIIAINERGEKLQCMVSIGRQIRNPILPESWNLYIADPEPYVFDDIMYIYGSRDNPFGKNEYGRNQFCSSEYHTIYSKDLKHWFDAGMSINVKEFPNEIKERYDNNLEFLWAPDLFRSPINNKFYLVFCSTDSIGAYFIAESDEPIGPFGNIQEITYKNSRIGNIDPGMLVEKDKVYMAMPKPFRIGLLEYETNYSTLKEDYIIDVQEAINKDSGYYGFEGPSLRKFGEYYYFIYIASKVDERSPLIMKYLISKNIEFGWKYGGDIINTTSYLDGANVHGSIEEYNGKYFLFYHRIVPSMYSKNSKGKDAPFTRQLCLEEIEIDPITGLIKEVVTTSTGAFGIFKKNSIIYAYTAVGFATNRTSGPFIRNVDSNKLTVKLDSLNRFVEFKYVDLIDCKIIMFKVKTNKDDIKIKCCNIEESIVFAETVIENTNGEWKKVNIKLNSEYRKTYTLKLMLETQSELDEIEIDYIKFM